MQQMKLNHLNEEERQILKLVVEEYYAVLPPALQVHSLFATHILSHTLHRFGIRTRVLPCRLWCSSMQPQVPRRRDNVGGVVNYWNSEKWNGHVVCIVGDWLVDAALYHLNPSFNYEVPKIIARRIVRPEPEIYTRYQLNRKTEFIWYRLPPKVSAVSVAGYEDFIDRFVNDLYMHIRRLLGYVDEAPPDPLDEALNDGGIEITAEQSVTQDDVASEEESGSGAQVSAEGEATDSGSENIADDAQEKDAAAAESGEQAISDIDSGDEGQGTVAAAEQTEKTEEPEAAPA